MHSSTSGARSARMGEDTTNIYQEAGLEASRFRSIRTHALGLFDTVAALDGKRARFLSPAEREKLAFVDEGVLHAADHIFQALALLERRRDFEPCVLRRTEDGLDLRQCWFAGCHADVGGDKSNKNPLHHFPLLWMMTILRPFVSFAETRVIQHILHDLKPIIRVYAGKTVNDKDQEWVDSYYSKHIYKLSGPQPRVDALTSSMGNMSLVAAEPPSSSTSARLSSSLKSHISRALRPPPSILADLEHQAAKGTTNDLSDLNSSITTIHWTVAMFEAWTRSSFKATHSPLAGYTRRTIFTPPLADDDEQPAPAGNMGSLQGTVWQSTSTGVSFWEEPLAELEGDFMIRGYGAKYGTDEVELFFNDAALAAMEPSDAGAAVFDDRHGNYQGLDHDWQQNEAGEEYVETGEEYYRDEGEGYREEEEEEEEEYRYNSLEKLGRSFNPAVLEEEEERASQIYLPISADQISRVNEAIIEAGLGGASLTFEQKLRYLEGLGGRYRY